LPDDKRKKLDEEKLEIVRIWIETCAIYYFIYQIFNLFQTDKVPIGIQIAQWVLWAIMSGMVAWTFYSRNLGMIVPAAMITQARNFIPLFMFSNVVQDEERREFFVFVTMQLTVVILFHQLLIVQVLKKFAISTNVASLICIIIGLIKRVYGFEKLGTHTGQIVLHIILTIGIIGFCMFLYFSLMIISSKQVEAVTSMRQEVK